MRVRITAALFALVTALAAVSPAIAQDGSRPPEEERVYRDFEADGAITPCRHQLETLKEVLDGIDEQTDADSPDFRPEVEAAITEHEDGACDEAQAPGSGGDQPGADGQGTGDGDGGTSGANVGTGSGTADAGDGSGGADDASGGGDDGSSGAAGGGTSGSTGGGAGTGNAGGDTGTATGTSATGGDTPTASGDLGATGDVGAAAPPTAADVAPLPADTPVPGAAPATSAPPAAPATPAVAYRNADDGVPPSLLVLAGLLAALALVALLYAVVSRFAWADEHLDGPRRACREAAFRAGATWGDFTDWLRLGR